MKDDGDKKWRYGQIIEYRGDKPVVVPEIRGGRPGHEHWDTVLLPHGESP